MRLDLKPCDRCESRIEVFRGDPSELDFELLKRRLVALDDNHRCFGAPPDPVEHPDPY